MTTPVSPSRNPLENELSLEIKLQEEYDKERHFVAQKMNDARQKVRKEEISAGDKLDLGRVATTASTTVIGNTSQSVSVGAEVQAVHRNAATGTDTLDTERNISMARAPVSNIDSQMPETNTNAENMTRQLVNRDTTQKRNVQVEYNVIDRTRLAPQTDRFVMYSTEEKRIDTRDDKEKYLNAEQSSDALLRDINEPDDDLERGTRSIMEQYNQKRKKDARPLAPPLQRILTRGGSDSDFFGEKPNPLGGVDDIAYSVDDLQNIVPQATDKPVERHVNRMSEPTPDTELELGEHPHDMKSIQTNMEDLDDNMTGISGHDTREFTRQRHRLVGMTYQRVVVKRKDDAIQTNPPKISVTIVPQEVDLRDSFPFDTQNRVIDCKYSVLKSKVAEVERVRREKHKTESPIKDIKVRYDDIIPWDENGLQKLCASLQHGRVSILYGHGFVKYLHLILDLLLIMEHASFSLFAVKDSVVYDLNYLRTKPLAETASKMEECILDELTGEPLDAVRSTNMEHMDKLVDLIHIINGGDDSYQSIHLMAHIFTDDAPAESTSIDATTQSKSRSAENPSPDLYIVQMADSQRPMYLGRRDELQGAFDSVHKQLTSLGIVLNALNTSRLRIPYHKSTISTMLKYPLDSMQYSIDIFVFLSSESHQVFENMHILKFTKAAAQSGIGEIHSRSPAVDIELLKHENTLLQTELKIAKKALPNEYSVACTSIEKLNEEPLTDKKINKLATKIKQEIKKNVKKIAGVGVDADFRFRAYKSDQDTFHKNRTDAIRTDILRIRQEIEEHTQAHSEKFTHLRERDEDLCAKLELLHTEMERLTMEQQMLENSISREESDFDLLAKKLQRLETFDARTEGAVEDSDEATHQMRVKLAEHAKRRAIWREEFAIDQLLIQSFNKHSPQTPKYDNIWFSHPRQFEYEDYLGKILDKTILLKEHSFVQNLMNMTDEQLKELQVRNFQLRQVLKQEETKMQELDNIKKEQLDSLIAEGRSLAHTKLAEFIRWKKRTLMAFVQKGSFMRKISEAGKPKMKFFWIRMDENVPYMCCCDVMDNLPQKDRITKTINLLDDVVDIQLGQSTPRFQRYFRRSDAGVAAMGKTKRRTIPSIFGRKRQTDEPVEPLQIARESTDFTRSFTIVYKKKRKFLDLVVEKGTYEFWLLALRDLTGILPAYSFPVPVEDSEMLANAELECCSKNHISVKGILEVKASIAKREPYDTITVVDVKQASDRINIIQAYHIFESIYVPDPNVVTMVESPPTTKAEVNDHTVRVGALTQSTVYTPPSTTTTTLVIRETSENTPASVRTTRVVE